MKHGLDAELQSGNVGVGSPDRLEGVVAGDAQVEKGRDKASS